MKLRDLGKKRLFEREEPEEKESSNPMHDKGVMHGAVSKSIDDVMRQVITKITKVEAKTMESLVKLVDGLADQVSELVRQIPSQKDHEKYMKKINQTIDKAANIASKLSEIEENAQARGPDVIRKCIAKIAKAKNTSELHDYIENNGVKTVANEVYNYYHKEVTGSSPAKPKSKKTESKSKPKDKKKESKSKPKDKKKEKKEKDADK